MKVVRIIARLNVGGPARHVVWLNQALQDDEFDSVLLTGIVPEGEDDMRYFADEHGVKPIFIEEMSREVSLSDIVALWRVYRQFLKLKPNIVHTHTAKAGTIGRIAGLFYRWLTFKTLIGQPRKVRIIHTFHGHVFHSYYGPLKTKLFLFIEKALARFATNKIVVISKQQKQEINDEFKIGKSDQFEIIPLGLDLSPLEGWREHRNVLREELGANEEDILVGLVGRLTEVKNHELFLDVAKMYEESEEKDLPNITFLIIGDGHMRGFLEEQAGKLGIGNRLRFMGNRNDPEVFYAGLDVVALTSLNEGTPLSLIEAMACEKPVISTIVGGVSDLLGKSCDPEWTAVYERGIGVASNDVKGFYENLIRLVRDKRLQSNLTKNGKSFVQEKYSKNRLIDDVKSLYRSFS